MTTTDQMGRTVHLPEFPPRRIISLVPSQTELLADLGLDNEVAGITKFCIHPDDWRRRKTRVGGTKTINLQKVEALEPDLIIGNKEENDREQIESLASRYPVWMSDIRNLDQALDMIVAVGRLCDKQANADVLCSRITERFDRLADLVSTLPPKRAAYFIWRKPYMAAGNDTFIHHMLERCGLQNVLADKPRYPEVFLDELAEMSPDIVLLSSEPYPFSEKHIAEFPAARVIPVDGEMFSWYGSRLLPAADYLMDFVSKIHNLPPLSKTKQPI